MQEKGKNTSVKWTAISAGEGRKVSCSRGHRERNYNCLIVACSWTVCFVNIVSQDAPFIVLMLYLSIKTMNDLQCFYSSPWLRFRKHTVFVLIWIWTHSFTYSFTVVAQWRVLHSDDCVTKVFQPLQLFFMSQAREDKPASSPVLANKPVN